MRTAVFHVSPTASVTLTSLMYELPSVSTAWAL
jgi:hypothetical protein